MVKLLEEKGVKHKKGTDDFDKKIRIGIIRSRVLLAFIRLIYLIIILYPYVGMKKRIQLPKKLRRFI